MKIEDILKKLIKSYDKNKKLKDKYNEDTMRFVLNTEETELLLNYIADLQRKEYNNSKAIEYIKQQDMDYYGEVVKTKMDCILTLLEKGE